MINITTLDKEQKEDIKNFITALNSSWDIPEEPFVDCITAFKSKEPENFLMKEQCAEKLTTFLQENIKDNIEENQKIQIFLMQLLNLKEIIQVEDNKASSDNYYYSDDDDQNCDYSYRYNGIAITEATPNYSFYLDASISVGLAALGLGLLVLAVLMLPPVGILSVGAATTAWVVSSSAALLGFFSLAGSSAPFCSDWKTCGKNDENVTAPLITMGEI